jgi:hypothetical protein
MAKQPIVMESQQDQNPERGSREGNRQQGAVARRQPLSMQAPP